MDWTSLPGELVFTFSRLLRDPADYVSLRAVCRSWRSAVPLPDAPLFLPWFALAAAGEEAAAAARRFHSPFSGAFRSVAVAARQRKIYAYGKCHGHLLDTASADTMALVNPLTGARRALPPLRCATNSLFFACTPTSSGNLAVLLYDRYNSRFNFCRPGDESWVEFRLMGIHHPPASYGDGKLFFPFWRGFTAVIDAGTLGFAGIIQPPAPAQGDDCECSVVESPEIGLVCVARHREGKIEVYRFAGAAAASGAGDGAHSWVLTASIGDDALFLCGNHGFAVRAGGGWRGVKGNSVYCNFAGGGSPFRYAVGDGAVEVLDQHVPAAWEFLFVPSLC